ncbi:MAG: phenylacetate--CoA ligase family protein [Rhodocyclaceae bacterium]|nr:phenylacetate--CoA ligase family protein [Rhodocyclaceae bacterium]
MLSRPDQNGVRIDPEVRSVVSGIGWPAIGADAAAHLQALLFQMERSQWLPEESLRERQFGQLKLLLRHACSTVPHYAEMLRGIDTDGLDRDSFSALPLLTRKSLQSGFESLQSTAVPPGHGAVVQGQSSGSTGMPVRFLQTAVTQFFWNALTVREHLWQQRDFSGKLAAIRIKMKEGSWPDWGLPVAALFRTGPGATLNVRTDVERQLAWLVREDPDYLITHASNLHALAELSLKQGVRLPRLRQARTYSEALRPDLRETVRAAWGVQIADGYSCEEAGNIALQCPRHEHYHIQSENLLVEILDEAGRPCAPGETGRVVITTLHNFAMPLIRYELGDYAEVGEPCECGRGLPVLTRILGRRRNMVVLPDGRRHWPSMPSAMWHAVAPIEQFQVTQTGIGSLEVKYVMGRPLSQEEIAGLEQALAERFSHAFDIVWQRVDAIERGQGGKYEDFISLLA